MRVVLILFFTLPLISFAKKQKQVRKLANSPGEVIEVKYSEIDGQGEIVIRIEPSQKDLAFFWSESRLRGIAFNCHQTEQGWNCVNDCQMGAVTITFLEKFKKIRLAPYHLIYNSCGGDRGEARVDLRSSKPKDFVRVD